MCGIQRVRCNGHFALHGSRTYFLDRAADCNGHFALHGSRTYFLDRAAEKVNRRMLLDEERERMRR